MNRPPPDVGLAIAMSISLPMLDLEAAARELSAAGFDSIEVFVGQIGPRIVDAPLLAAQGSAVASLLDRVGLVPSSLNAIVDHFEPTSSDRLDAAIRWLALNMELAREIGSPRVVIWDGLDDPAETTEAMIARLLQCVDRGVAAAGNDGPAISVEFHPNTFALARGVIGEVAHRLTGVGAGVCLDFCHFGVALGARFVDDLDQEFIGCVNHIHVADSDCLSEQLHFPLDEGVLDLDVITSRLAGRGLAAAWDTFGWPAPRQMLASGIDRYRDLVGRLAAEEERSTT